MVKYLRKCHRKAARISAHRKCRGHVLSQRVYAILHQCIWLEHNTSRTLLRWTLQTIYRIYPELLAAGRALKTRRTLGRGPAHIIWNSLAKPQSDDQMDAEILSVPGPLLRRNVQHCKFDGSRHEAIQVNRNWNTSDPAHTSNSGANQSRKTRRIDWNRHRPA